MMPHYRGMNRGFCRVAYSHGFGLGTCSLLIRLSPDPEREAALRDWLTTDALHRTSRHTRADQRPPVRSRTDARDDAGGNASGGERQWC